MSSNAAISMPSANSPYMERLQWNTGRPICSFPQEVISLFLRCCTVPLRLSALRVCRAWNSAGDGIPDTWGNIYFQGSRTGVSADSALAEALRRSKSAKLDFEVDTIDHYSDPILVAIRTNMHRLRSIVVHGRCSRDLMAALCLPAPFLRHIAFHNNHTVLNGFLGRSPGTLRCLEMGTLMLPTVGFCPALSGLTHMIVRGDRPIVEHIAIDRLFMICPRLELLWLDCLGYELLPTGPAPHTLTHLHLGFTLDVLDPCAIRLALPEGDLLPDGQAPRSPARSRLGTKPPTRDVWTTVRRWMAQQPMQTDLLFVGDALPHEALSALESAVDTQISIAAGGLIFGLQYADGTAMRLLCSETWVDAISLAQIPSNCRFLQDGPNWWSPRRSDDPRRLFKVLAAMLNLDRPTVVTARIIMHIESGMFQDAEGRDVLEALRTKGYRVHQ